MNDDIKLRISEVEVKGLFGLYDHSVKLFLEDRVTIVHGQNGVGKTALLRLIEALVKGKFIQLIKIPLDSFCLRLTDNSEIGIRKAYKKSGNGGNEGSQGTTEVYYISPTKHQEKIEIITNQTKFESILRMADREIPWIRRVGPDQWHDRQRDEMISSDQLIERYADELPSRFKKLIFQEPEWLTAIRQQLKVHFIETQRLLKISPSEEGNPYSHSSSGRITATVQKYATELKQRIAETMAEYAKSSQLLDQSFPQRLLANNARQTLTIEELKRRMEALDKKRAELKKIGLVDEDTTYPFDVSKLDSLQPTERGVMTLYVDDTANKLGVLDKLADRLSLLLNNMNIKFRNKSIGIDKKLGLVAKDREGSPLNLEELSSGEQHELVLMYDLLFRVEPDTLVMIDEPELSLHVIWQKAFITDLLAIVQTVGFDVLLATHSPFIAGERNDLMIALPSIGDVNQVSKVAL